MSLKILSLIIYEKLRIKKIILNKKKNEFVRIEWKIY